MSYLHNLGLASGFIFILGACSQPDVIDTPPPQEEEEPPQEEDLREVYDLSELLQADYGFIMFSVDGCGYCVRTLPRFNALQDLAEEQDISDEELSFAYINLSHTRPEPRDFLEGKIEFVPAFIEVHEGEEIMRYIGAGEELDQFEQRVNDLIEFYQ